ncbi:hypothetical protein JOM56_013112 [Amanita muscaria]
MALQPQLPSLNKLRFLASRQPVDTFYRASDLTLGHFEALVFVPASELAQCRLTIVNAYKSVHDAIREFGDQDSIEDEVSEMMDKVMELMKDIEQHAEIDESFENDLASLRNILQERPKVGELPIHEIVAIRIKRVCRWCKIYHHQQGNRLWSKCGTCHLQVWYVPRAHPQLRSRSP